MKYYIDFEFNIEDPSNKLISVGIVREDGEYFYHIFDYWKPVLDGLIYTLRTKYKGSNENLDWLRANVFDRLDLDSIKGVGTKYTDKEFITNLELWFNGDEDLTFISDHPEDIRCLISLLIIDTRGGTISLPKETKFIVHDVNPWKTLPNLNKAEQHNSYVDARALYQLLEGK